MKLILEIRPHLDEEQVTHVILDKFPATIGRGFDNDVILTDPYVSPHHLRLNCTPEACTVSDLGSNNGFHIIHAAHPGKANPRHEIHSGDLLHIGQTKIRIFTPDHAVPAALRLQRPHSVFAWLARSVNVWICFFLALALTLGWAFVEIWTDEPGLVLVASAASTAGVIVLWAALWSVAGRLTKHKANFKTHIAMASLYLVLGTLAWYVEEYTDFLTNENWFSTVVTYGLNFILIGFLLYGSLTIATRLTQRRRTAISAFLSFGIIGGIFVFSLVSAKTFNQQPLYPSTLEPYLTRLAPTDSIDGFMLGNEDLFSADGFTH